MTVGVPAQAWWSDTGAHGGLAQYETEGLTYTTGNGAPTFEQVNGIWLYTANNGSTQIITPVNAFSSASGYVHVWFYLQGQQAFNLCNSDGNAQIQIVFNSGGSISVVSGSTTLATSAVNSWFANVFGHLKIYFNVSTTAGSVILRLYGSPYNLISTATNLNTAPYASNIPVVKFIIPWENTGSNGFGSIVVHDGTGASPFNGFLPGEPIVAPLFPTANGSTVQYTPEGLSQNWQNVANNPPVLTDYNQAATSGLIDQSQGFSLPSNVQQVFGYSHFDYSQETGGSAAQTKTVINGSNTAAGTQNYLAGSWVTYQDFNAYSLISPTTLMANIAASTIISEFSGYKSQIARTA